MMLTMTSSRENTSVYSVFPIIRGPGVCELWWINNASIYLKYCVQDFTGCVINGYHEQQVLWLCINIGNIKAYVLHFPE